VIILKIIAKKKRLAYF